MKETDGRTAESDTNEALEKELDCHVTVFDGSWTTCDKALDSEAVD